MKKYLLVLIVFFMTFSVYAASNNQEVLSMKLSISISSDSGNHTLSATLYDNSSSRALVELLQKGPVTIDMHDYGSFEKVGSLPWDLPRNDKQITTEPGDVILYQGNQITVYYDTNSWNFTRLARIGNTSKDELLAALGDGGVSVKFSLEWGE